VWVNLIEVDLRQIAVEVTADDFTAGLEHIELNDALAPQEPYQGNETVSSLELTFVISS